MEHIKNVIGKDIQVGLISDTDSLMDVLAKIQDILDSNEILSLIKGNINELYHFDDEIKKLKDTFDELHNEKTGLVPNKVINKRKPKKLKLDDAANIDGVMIAMIANIGILLFLILMLNILK